MKKLSFIATDGNEYTVAVTQVRFNDNGTNRVKFLIESGLALNCYIQRLEGDHWIMLEGDMKQEDVFLLGKIIRGNFDT